MQNIQELLRVFGRAFVWFVVVMPWEQAVRIRLGKRTKLLGPGLHFRIPYVDVVYGQCSRRRIKIIPAQTVTTRDGTVITLSGAVGFAVSDVMKLYNSLSHVDDTIECEVGGIIAEYVADNYLSSCTPPEVEEFVRKTLKLDKYGLSGQEFYITNFAKTRALRLITGEIKQWQSGSGIDISLQQGQT